MPSSSATPAPTGSRSAPEMQTGAETVGPREAFPARLTRAVGMAFIPALFFGTQAQGQGVEGHGIEGQEVEGREIERVAALGADIVVTGRYLSNDKLGAAKVPIPVIDVPQSLTVTTEEDIEAQAFRDLGDVLRFTPGAAVAQGEGHRDQITLRGQNTTADFFLDGIRDDVQYFRPLYNLEQVEILRGANALIFGRGGGGGAVNRVTKRPDMAESFGELTVSGDTFGSAFASLDLNAAPAPDAGLRLNAFVEHLDNHRDVFDGTRWAVNPTFAVEFTPDTRLDLSYEYIDDDRVVDRGVPSLDGEPVRGFTDTFFGSPDLNRTRLEAHILRARGEQRLGEGLSANATLHYANYDKLYQNLFPVGLSLSPEGDTVSLDGYRDATRRDNLIAQANIVAEFDTGPLSQTLLVGAEYGNQDTDNSRRDALFAASDDDQIAFALSRLLAFDIPAVGFPVLNRDRASEVDFWSLYAQSQTALELGWGELQIVGGLRYDDFSIEVDDRANGRVLESDDAELSPRVGAIFKPREDLSLYASWSRSFLPRAGDQFLTLSPTAAALDPEEFENLEAGIKWMPVRGFDLTFAAFELERDAGSVVDPRDVGNTILVGARTRGVEAELRGQLTESWHVHAGYSYLDADERGRVAEDGLSLEDRTLPSVPEHMAFAWTRYDFERLLGRPFLNGRLGVGAGVTYQSAQFASISNAVELPDFARVDAALYFEASEALEVQLNVENLLDIDYFPAAHNDNNISTGEPLNARLTLRGRF